LFNELGGKFAETNLDKILEVNIAGFNICKENCNLSAKAANFELGCKCMMHITCLISSIQKGQRKCKECGCGYKREKRGLKYEFKASDYEKLLVNIEY